MDLRVGGVWKLKMVIDEGTEYFTGGVYRKIVPVEKLVFTRGASDGWSLVSSAGSPTSPLPTAPRGPVGRAHVYTLVVG